MSDLTEYDREIVKEAEAAWQQREEAKRKGSILVFAIPDLTGLYAAVQAKRDAQRPLCTLVDDSTADFCENLAVQSWESKVGTHYRCDEHRIEVREL